MVFKKLMFSRSWWGRVVGWGRENFKKLMFFKKLVVFFWEYSDRCAIIVMLLFLYVW